MARPSSIKEEARKALEMLDDDVSWQDIIYTMYIHEKRARGLADSLAGRTLSIEEMAREFGVKLS
jgi:hypothetical protein